ncbi:MAG TPA: SpvB/TcaC N-terminal domain-containing protein [Bacillota bacterium]|nr:SpvB/TcaC N-terminal domain-containing protein [Bacillota bacterium]
MPNEAPKSKISIPQIALPKGGGAIKGLGETFQPNPFSGTGSFSLPVYTSPCRGFEPKLSLDYHSASGNGPFGLGFSLSIPNIVRKTEKRIPKYDDSDIFILSNAEDLVPVKVRSDGDWTVTSYQPRIEGLFAQIEWWKNATESYWKVVTKENITSFYGKTAGARIADPEDGGRIFQWLLEETIDAKENKIQYTYVSENTDNVPAEIYEQNRSHTAHKYLQTIKYGNYFDKNGQEAWAFEVVLDYGEYNIEAESLAQKDCNPYQPAQKWPARHDPFSDYHSGFEIRTHRFCRNILLFHHLPELGEAPCLVRATRMIYQEPEDFSPLTAPITLLIKVQVEGYRRQGDGSYEFKTMPSLEFGYSEFNPAGQKFQTLAVADGGVASYDGAIPGYLNSSQYDLVDLYGEGLPGILHSDSLTTLYWKPHGDGKYGGPQPPVQFPIERDLGVAEYALVSLEGNGKLDLVAGAPQRGGFYQCNPDGSWEPYRSFSSYPLDYVNPHKEMVDCDGDGIPEVMVFEEQELKIYPSLKKEGYGPPTRAQLAEGFPALDPEYAEEVLSFTDLLGDGLSHRARIRNGRVECWPNLGYGRFGSKLLLGKAPRFGDELDASRLFLADIDGSGTTDILYVHPDRIDIYFNQGGNRFSEPFSLPLPERYDKLDQISFGDVNGNGTTCLIFTKISPEVRHYYYDFAGGAKPYLLNQIDNHLGAQTHIYYRSSVQSYLEDQQSGRPWKTRLPFPVQVVEKTESFDRISGSKLTTLYKYHDGYYNYMDREFRGFGFVEEWDTEDFTTYHQTASPAEAGNTLPVDEFVPPVHTKRWYHTGAFLEAGVISRQYRDEYYQGDAQAYLMPESSFDPEIGTGGVETLRQAYRALKGQLLREEVYGEDDQSGLSEHPYTVTESNFHVRLLQPKNNNEYAVFLVHGKENISYHYERNPADPRIGHQITLEVDPYGNTTKACQVHYPRRESDYEEQKLLKATTTVSFFIQPRNDLWLHSIPYENQVFEIGGLELESGQVYFSEAQIKNQLLGQALKHIIRYDQEFTPGQKQARCFHWEQDYYWNQAQTDYLPLGGITAQALLHHSQNAVFTPELIQTAFQNRVTSEILTNYGGYYPQDGYWWNRGLVRHYYQAADRKFYQPWKIENTSASSSSSLFQKVTLEYDPYCLGITHLAEYLTETITNDTYVILDYITIQPKQITEINDNVAQALFDPLGMVIATSLYGTVDGQQRGDRDLSEYRPTPETTFEKVLQSLVGPEPGKNPFLQQATTFFDYDLFAWDIQKQPARFISLLRETHVSDLAPGQTTKIQVHIGYSDGLGRENEQKIKADPGPAFFQDASGGIKNEVTADRWAVSGRTVYNNKGKPVKKYDPFFSATPDYEDRRGVEPLLPAPTVIHYDPLLREIRIDTPKGKPPKGDTVLGFFSKVEFSPWEERHYDANDTIRESDYYQDFMKHYPENPTESEKDQKDALDKAAGFYDTPDIKVLDTMGYNFLEIQNNLGGVLPEAFAEMVAQTPVTPEELWNQLISKGYLEARGSLPGAWVAAKFQPYRKDFQLALDDQYRQFADPIVNLLRQNYLISYHGFDIQGRELLAVDPRLYYANVTQGAGYYNFKYIYDMTGKDPLVTDSADAGCDSFLNNIFGNLIWSWSPRNFNQWIDYDPLQRKKSIRVKGFKDDGTLVTDNTVEIFTYGESQERSKERNLRGQVYELKDQSGIIQNSLYDLEGELLKTSRQLTLEYKQAINWDPDVPMEQEIYHSQFTYDALKRLLTETTPDNSVTTNTYNQVGLLNTVNVRYFDSGVQKVIDHIEYDANGLRLTAASGNGVQTIYTYEETTRHLIGLQSARPGQDIKGNPRDTILQDIDYTYDPVGNITRIRDKSIATVFHDNQKVEPLSDYTYDALYRLIKASGRQHQDINAHTYINNRKFGDFKQSKLASPNDGNQLENYSERYSYDEAGNLVETSHTATNAWTRGLEIRPDSNRIKTIITKNGAPVSQAIEYDRSGNQKQLDLNSTVDLTWNCCENLIRAGFIQRPDEADDCDYYTYDSKEVRTRKISERMAGGGSVVNIEEKIYLGNYEIKRVKQGATVILERQTLRIMDDKTCVAIIHYWKQDDRKREVDAPGIRKLRYQMGNHLGSISLEVNENAALISYEEYFPYGGTAIIAGDNQKEVELKEYRYSGKECDDSTGLYYYGARYYAPWLGRWMKPDPAGTVDGLNLYAFVKGNPVKHIDVEGYWGESAFLIAAVVLVIMLALATKSCSSNKNRNLQQPTQEQQAQVRPNKPRNRRRYETKQTDIGENVGFSTSASTIASTSAIKTASISLSAGSSNSGVSTSTNASRIPQLVPDPNAAEMFFGQVRIASHFQSLTTGTPEWLTRTATRLGKEVHRVSIEDVANELRQGNIRVEDMAVHYFMSGSTRVTINNRTLAAISLAGLRPTQQIIEEEPSADVTERLSQSRERGVSTVLYGSNTSHYVRAGELPSDTILVTGGQSATSSVLGAIRIPRKNH